VRLHEIGEVQAVLSPGKLDRGHTVGAGNVGVGTVGQKQFDHLCGSLQNGVVKGRVPTAHAELTLEGAVLLIRVSTEFQEKSDLSVASSQIAISNRDSP